jgi:predicted hotdog family 3-hydroxylacyl-ACP dehydratase
MEVVMTRYSSCKAVALGVGILLAACVTATARAQTNPNFSGTWVFNPARSQNIGMMASMEDTVTIVQTASQVTITERARMQGQDSTRETHFDLTGKAVTNAGPMGEQNDTVAKWVERRLVVTWTADGAVAGSKVVRTETRSLSADGKAMTVESVRGSNAPVVMMFDRR